VSQFEGAQVSFFGHVVRQGTVTPIAAKALILCFRSEKFPMTMQAGGSLFIIHYSLFIITFNDQKVAVGGSILAIYYGNKVVLVLQQ